MSSPSLVVGFFVGGRARRFGGLAKGNLTAPNGERLLERLVRVAREALPRAPLALVGAATAYGELGLPTIADAPPGVGPLGGLRGLLAHADRTGAEGVIALACDLPFVGAGLVRRLAVEAPHAWFLGPRDGTIWQPLAARYRTPVLATIDEALAAGDHSLKGVIARLGEHAVPLALSTEERAELRDWDSPEDVE